MLARTRSLWTLLALVFAINVTAVWAEDAATGQPAEPSRAEGIDREKLGKLTEKMQQFVEGGQAAGIVTLVAHQGQVVHLGAVGYADLEKKAPLREDSVFAIASMTKPVTATAVMILVDEGKLSLDDPVSKYIPEFKETMLKSGSPSRTVTIRHVLTHTSGLGGEQRNDGSLKETVEKMAKRPLDFEPGEKWQYSPGLSVAGRVLEVASGQDFGDFVQQRIFQPLKMVDTTFQPTQEQQARLAKLYKPGPGGKSLELAAHWLNDAAGPRTPNPSGGLFSTAADMGRFYQMVLNGGELDGKRILSEDSVQEMTKVQTGDLTTGFTDGNGWGLGWCVVREPQGVTKTLSPGSFGHGGALGTQGWVDPKQKMIFVLMVQRQDFGNGDASDLRAALQETAVGALRK